MSDTRICLVGGTGMIGTMTMAQAATRGGVRIVAVGRQEAAVPPGAPVEQRIGETARWPALIAAAQAEVMVCAIGTTRARAGSPEAFQAIDRDLVVACGRAARAAGIERMILVSSLGADAGSRLLYLRTKGEAEAGLAALGFSRLDILHPAQLRGERAEHRPAERLSQAAFRVLDLCMRGPLRRFHSIEARDVADAALSLAGERHPGHFVHDYSGIRAIAARD